MISYEKAKMGKQLMKQFIAEGELEKAAFIGLMYQMPIRTGDAVTLQKSDLDGRIVLKASSKMCIRDRKDAAIKYAHTLAAFFSSGWQTVLGI